MVVVPIHFYVPQGTGAGWGKRGQMGLATGLYAANRAGILFQMSGVTGYTGPLVASNCTNVSALVSASPACTTRRRQHLLRAPDQRECLPGVQLLPGVHRHQRGHRLPLRTSSSSSNARASSPPGARARPHAGTPERSRAHQRQRWLHHPEPAAWAPSPGRSGGTQTHISLGQVYRMSLDELSWLNHARPTRTPGIRRV